MFPAGVVKCSFCWKQLKEKHMELGKMHIVIGVGLFDTEDRPEAIVFGAYSSEAKAFQHRSELRANPAPHATYGVYEITITH